MSTKTRKCCKTRRGFNSPHADGCPIGAAEAAERQAAACDCTTILTTSLHRPECKHAQEDAFASRQARADLVELLADDEPDGVFWAMAEEQGLDAADFARDWDAETAERKIAGGKRRQDAKATYAEAAALARANGLKLIRHSEQHYSLRSKKDDWILGVYPGNGRIYNQFGNPPFLNLPKPWTLIEVVQVAAAKVKS